MKKMKTAFLTALLVLALTACGKENAAPSEDSSGSTNTETQGETDTNTKTSKPSASMQFDTSGKIEETILMDENGIKITATGLNYSKREVALQLLIENNSSQELSFSCNTLGYACNAINGYMVSDGYMSTDVDPGNKANETVSFSIDELKLLGINKIADIQIGFEITDENYDSTYSGIKQITTAFAESYDYETDTYQELFENNGLSKQLGFTVDYFETKELFNDCGVRIISEAVITNRNGESSLFLEVENNSDQQFIGSVSDLVFNGLVVSDGTWTNETINPGTRGIISVPFASVVDESLWETLGFTEIGTFSCFYTLNDMEYEELTYPQELEIVLSKKNVSFDPTGTEIFNENNIRIVSKGIHTRTGSYSDDVSLLLLVENQSSDSLYIAPEYDSLSLNGFMTDFICYGRSADPGETALLEVEISEMDLEENQLSSVEDITEAEITLEIRDDSYRTVAAPRVKMTYGE